MQKRPDVYFFNPTCEYAIASGNPSWQPNRILRKMESDLSSIQLFLAGGGDFIIADKIPSREYQHRLLPLVNELPEFVLKSKIAGSNFSRIPKNRLLPWGWSPAAHKLLQPLKDSCSEDFKNSPVFNWNSIFREKFSKRFALTCLEALLREVKYEKIFLSPQKVPVVCNSTDEVEKAVKRWGRIMVKAPWSSSGRGLQPVTKTPVHEKVWERIGGMIAGQGFVLAEPYLNKIIDFSFQFEIKRQTIRFLGISNFITDKKGQYQGNFLNGRPENTDAEITRFQQLAIQKTLPPLIAVLESSELKEYYEGFFGVDTLVFTGENRELKINPCMEINLRQNMGLLSLHLEGLLANRKQGVYRMFHQPGTTFRQFSEQMQKRFPAVFNSESKLESGFFPLTEDSEEALFGAYLFV